jgi:hypothetical protein
MDGGLLQSISSVAVLRYLLGLACTALLTIAGIVVKQLLQDRKDERQWRANVSRELTLQRTNCLTTLQEQGEKQIELLEKLVVGQAEQTGFMKGKL